MIARFALCLAVCSALAASSGARAESIPILGGTNSIVLAPSGDTAYIGADSAVLVFDVASRTAVRTISVPRDGFNGPYVEDVDPTTGLIGLRTFDEAGVLDPGTGVYRQILRASAVYGIAFAGGDAYVPSFNDRVVHVVGLDGSSPIQIDPGSVSPSFVATPCGVAASPGRSTVVVADDDRNALYLLRGRAHVGTQSIGGSTCDLAFVDDTTVIVASAIGASYDYPDVTFGEVSLLSPGAVPRAFDAVVSGWVSSILVDSRGETIYVLFSPYPDDDPETPAGEIVAIDRAKGSISGRRAVGADPTGMVWIDGGKALLVATSQGVQVESLPIRGQTSTNLTGCLSLGGVSVADGNVVVRSGRKRSKGTTDGSGCFDVSVAGTRRGKKMTIQITVPAPE